MSIQSGDGDGDAYGNGDGSVSYSSSILRILFRTLLVSN